MFQPEIQTFVLLHVFFSADLHSNNVSWATVFEPSQVRSGFWRYLQSNLKASLLSAAADNMLLPQAAGPRQRDSIRLYLLVHCHNGPWLLESKLNSDRILAIHKLSSTLPFPWHMQDIIQKALLSAQLIPLDYKFRHTHNYSINKHLHTLAHFNTVQLYAHLQQENTKSTAARGTVGTMLQWLVIWDCFSGRVNWKIPAGKHAELILQRRPHWCV